MKKFNNVIKFPNLTDKKKKRMVQIRDEIEKILTSYAIREKDLWAVSLAAGRFSSINLEKLDGEDSTIKFFKDCIKTQKEFELSRNSSNIT
tara:strand:+ start:1983 stop:2255 length:273 start_codon:yes stop_codon:yes gene_type:complete